MILKVTSTAAAKMLNIFPRKGCIAEVIAVMVFQDDLFLPKNIKKSMLDNDAITKSANLDRIIAKHCQHTGLDGWHG